MQIHADLADLAIEKHPVAQWYLAKLLKHYSTQSSNDLFLTSQTLQSSAVNIFQENIDLFGNKTIRGLYLELIGKNEDAYDFFREGAENNEAFACHKLAQKYESKGNEEKALYFYAKAFILGYEPSLYEIAKLQYDDDESFLNLKKAGKRGNPRAYETMAQMIEEGFVPRHGQIEQNQEILLKQGMRQGSISCMLALGEYYKKQRKCNEAMEVYQAIANLGNIRGYLEMGKLLEQQIKYTECEALYRNPAIGWFGKYSLADITIDHAEKAELKKEADESFFQHFDKIILTINKNLER